MEISIKRRIINTFNRLPRSVQKGTAAALRRIPNNLVLGRDYAAVRRLLDETREFDRERVREYQFERFREIYTHAVRNIPFYTKWYGEHGLDENSVQSPEDIAALPLLDKERVRRHLEEMTWPDFPEKKRVRTKTGGTTGFPMVFYVERAGVQAQYAFMHDLWKRVDFRPRDRMISMARSEYNLKRGGLRQFFNPRDNLVCVSLDDLNRGTVKKYVDFFREIRPRFLLIYSSTLFILTQLMREAGLSLPPLRAILLHAQKQLAGQREIIERDTGCPQFLHYGQAERVILAAPCEHSRDYHVVPEYGWTELVDRDGGVIEGAGRAGELVGTGFFNRVMPLIRYRTGDFAQRRENQDCPCGRPQEILSGLRGRAQHFLVLPDGSYKGCDPGVGIFSLFAEYGRGFQLVQEEPGKITVRLAPLASNPPDYQQKIRPALQDQYFGPLEFEIVETDELELTDSGKPRFLIQKLKTPMEKDRSVTYWLDDE